MQDPKGTSAEEALKALDSAVAEDFKTEEGARAELEELRGVIKYARDGKWTGNNPILDSACVTVDNLTDTLESFGE